jgi:phage-related minor tail protein
MVHEVKNFNSEVLTDGGALMREAEREEAKQRKQEQQERDAIAQEAREAKEAQTALQREREEGRRALAARQEAKRLAAQENALKNEAMAKRIAEEAEAKAARAKADEENRQAAKAARNRELARAKEEQDAKQVLNKEAAPVAPRKSSMHALLDDLGDTSSTKAVPSKAPAPIFDHGVAHLPVHTPSLVPSIAPTLLGMESDINRSAVQSLNHILPGPSQVVSASLPESEPLHESGEECIARVLDSEEAEEESGAIRSKRGKERVQRLLQEKRALEDQLAKMQALVAHLQGTAEQAREEPSPARKKEVVEKQQAALVTEAKLEMLRFLNSRESEVDHLEKVDCFYRYMTNPFYMHAFVQNNRPDEWQGVLEYIYDAIEKPEPPKAKRSNSASSQPIRSRTSTLGMPVVHSSKPIERITEHLSNMGI